MRVLMVFIIMIMFLGCSEEPENLIKKDFYYRLNQVDYDGTETIYEVDHVQNYIHARIAEDTIKVPIELLSFNVTAKQGYNLIEFVTATEHNSDYVGIERSYNAKEWVEIVRIPSTNTLKETSYWYEDYYE